MMRGMVQRPARERAQRMTFITTLPLPVHTHPITAGLIDDRSFLFPLFVSRLQLLHDLLLSFLGLSGSCPRITAGALHKKGFQKGGGGGGGGGSVRGNPSAATAATRTICRITYIGNN